MNFARDLVDAADPARLALVEVARDGARREWTFAEVSAAAGAMAGALQGRGVRRGDVVLTVVGNRPEWVLAMLACFRIGAVALPCTEQLRPADLRTRMEVAGARAVVADERNGAAVEEAGFDGMLLRVPDEALLEGEPAP